MRLSELTSGEKGSAHGAVVPHGLYKLRHHTDHVDVRRRVCRVRHVARPAACDGRNRESAKVVQKPVRIRSADLLPFAGNLKIEEDLEHFSINE